MSNYDNWKTHNPDDDRCQYCGADARYSRGRTGWQPGECTGKCGIRWRDPDDERDADLDEGSRFWDWALEEYRDK